MPTTHPDEAVTPAVEQPSKLIAEAVLRHEAAQTDAATPQEKKQAAVEQAHALSTRPHGSYAQLHEVTPGTAVVGGPQGPLLAVPDEAHQKLLQAASQEAAQADETAVQEAQQVVGESGGVVDADAVPTVKDAQASKARAPRATANKE